MYDNKESEKYKNGTTVNSNIALNFSQKSYFAIPAFQDNYIWIIVKDNNAVVIDPGDARPVIHFLTKRNLQLKGILLTHHHHDHIGGMANLVKNDTYTYSTLSNIPIFGPVLEQIPYVNQHVSEGMTVQINELNLTFTIMDAPGHTLGHILFYQLKADSKSVDLESADKNNLPHLFCGDTLFSCGCGRLFEGTPLQMLASLDAIASLPDDTQIHCAHEYTLNNIRFALECEPNNKSLIDWQQKANALRAMNLPTLPTTLKHEKKVNPFLRLDSIEIQNNLAIHTGYVMKNRLDTFTHLRQWKDAF